ncbi:hypothetical protein T4B_3949 [Trichinella pseudospiralis]|uniref:Uncharacterized protein n=1 Tax=Trichinella pseudospiralis TaxID=6337 RepID=A0A0V1G7T7_TRIPS|nr:hypothetical protein T4B_3949 [Trichinella pseudospiralis]
MLSGLLPSSQTFLLQLCTRLVKTCAASSLQLWKHFSGPLPFCHNNL